MEIIEAGRAEETAYEEAAMERLFDEELKNLKEKLLRISVPHE